MFKNRFFIYSAVALSVASCGGSSSSGSDPELPSFVSLIQTQQAQNTAISTGVATANAVLPSDVVPVGDQPGTGTDFADFQTKTIGFEVPGNAPTKFINSVLCFTKQIVASDNVGTGAYRALVNEGRCFGEDDSVRYQEVTAEVTNITGGKQIDIWWDMGAVGENRARFVVTGNITEANPYGAFKMYLRQGIGGSGDESKIFASVNPLASDTTQFEIKVIGDYNINAAPDQNIQAYSVADFDESAGSAKMLDNGNDVVMTFTSDYIYQDDPDDLGNAEKCYNLGSTTDMVFGYTLFYNQDSSPVGSYVKGDMVNVAAGIAFTYQDSGTKNGWVDSNGLWSETTLGDGPHVVNGEDGETYRLTVSSGAVTNIERDSGGSNFVAFTLTDNITFTYTVDNDDFRNGDDVEAYESDSTITLLYTGKGSMPVIANDGSDDRMYSFENAVPLTANSVDYIIKANNVFKQAAEITDPGDDSSAAWNACSALTLPSYSDQFAASGDEALIFTNVDDNFISDTAPVVTASVKYVGGVLVE